MQANSVDLLPSRAPDPLLKAPVAVITDNTNAVLSNLTKLVLDQQQMLYELKDIQQRNMLALQDQITELKASVLEEKKAGLSEMWVDQRILYS